jgi:hypothetical protein
LLKNHHRSHLVDDMPMLLTRVPCLVKNLVSFVGGKPLIAQVNRQARDFAQLRCKRSGFRRLGAFGPIEMEGVSDHNTGRAEAPRQSSQGAEIFPPAATSFQGEDGLRGEAQFIGYSNADAPIADVETEIAGSIGGLQVFSFPESSLTRRFRGSGPISSLL